MINTIKDTTIAGIYKITSPSGKIYIGQSINIDRRKNEYIKLRCKKQKKLYYSLNKYGFDNHIFEIIYCGLNQLDELEIQFKQQVIDELGWEYALFSQLIDGKGGIKSEETRHKMSESNKGISRPRNKETIKKWKQSVKDKGGHWWGNKLGGKGIPRTKLNKPVSQFDKQGNFIKDWPNMSTAELYYSNNKDKDNIAACARGRQKTAYGFIWRY